MRREQVKKAILFDGPAYLPLYFFNRDLDKPAIQAVDVSITCMGG